jgi:hypothetical protein
MVTQTLLLSQPHPAQARRLHRLLEL